MPIGYGPPDADKIPLINIKLYSTAMELWPKRLLRDDGNANLPAVFALFHITRWYTPAEEVDGYKKETYYRKRYKGDQLQLSINQLSEASGITKQQARDALTFLEERGYINRSLRTIYYDNRTFPNTQFIALNAEAVIALSTVTTKDTDAMYEKAAANTEWDDDDYSIAPQEAYAPQDTWSGLQNTDDITIPSVPQTRPSVPQTRQQKLLQKLTKEEEAEAISFRNRGELENPSSCPTPEIVSPLSVSELEPALQNSNGVMSTGYVEQVKVFDVEQDIAVILPPNATYPITVKVQNAPVAAQVFAEILPAEPVTVKSKPKKAAAKPKAVKPPKAPHVFTQGELALIAELEAIDPNAAEAARGRCGRCRASDPWLISQIFLVTKARVPQLLWTDVAAVIGKSLDVKLLLTVYKAWVGKHIDPYNFGWLLEWYKAGGPPQYKSNGYGQQPTAVQPAPAPSNPKVEFDDPLVIGSTQWVMNTPGYGSMSPNSIRLGMWMAANNNEQYMFHLAEAPELLAKYQATH